MVDLVKEMQMSMNRFGLNVPDDYVSTIKGSVSGTGTIVSDLVTGNTRPLILGRGLPFVFKVGELYRLMGITPLDFNVIMLKNLKEYSGFENRNPKIAKIEPSSMSQATVAVPIGVDPMASPDITMKFKADPTLSLVTLFTMQMGIFDLEHGYASRAIRHGVGSDGKPLRITPNLAGVSIAFVVPADPTFNEIAEIRLGYDCYCSKTIVPAEFNSHMLDPDILKEYDIQLIGSFSDRMDLSEPQNKVLSATLQKLIQQFLDMKTSYTPTSGIITG